MRNTILLFAFISILSCKNSKVETDFEASKIKDINQIVETIIIEDTLDVLKNGKDSRMLCEELTKLRIYIPEKAKKGEIYPPLPPPPPFGNVSIESLLHYGKIGLFNVKDSLTLVNQNSNPQIFKIDKVLFDKFNLTTREKEIGKKNTKESFDFYEITIPIFSLDNKKAYVELSHYCGRLCGSGKAIYLKKINGKWKIIDSWRTWIS